MVSNDNSEGVLRSADGRVWGRDERGLLYELPPEARDRWQPDERHRVMAEAIDRAGLWDHVPALARARAVSAVASGRYPLVHEMLAEDMEFFADGEDLAEGGVERFLAKLAPALARHGVVLEVAAVEPPDQDPDIGDYVVSINGIRCVVWEARDLEQDWAQPDPQRGHPWDTATTRPLAVVNQLLGAAGSPARLHTLYAGTNQGLVYLMSPQVAQAMRASGLFPEWEIPHCL